MTVMYRIILVLLGSAALLVPAQAKEKKKLKGGWISMFDGKTLEGWKASERPDNWTVADGAIQGKGERSHLFWMKEECTDCEFKAEVKLNKGGNSGMYFRAQFMEGWPKGYEAQVNNSHKDPVKTGSLYNIVKIFDQHVPDDTWWTQHIIVQGNHIIIKVNDKVLVDHHDEKNSYASGYLALQQHDPGSVVQYRNLMYRPIKPKKK
jgi:hypothetical protein